MVTKTKTKTKKTSSAPKATKKAVAPEIKLEDLLAAGCHFGHSASRINPRMRGYVYATRDGIHIIDLVKTKEGLLAAIKFLSSLAEKNKEVILVGTKRQAQAAVEKYARKMGFFYVKKRWVGGLLTNWQEVKKNLDRLMEIEKELNKKSRGERTKYEQVLLKRQYNRLMSIYGGLKGLEEPPAAILVVDVKRERTAISEANKTGVKVVAIIDTNGDPAGIDYLIPANDDAQASIDYLLGQIAAAIENIKSNKK